MDFAFHVSNTKENNLKHKNFTMNILLKSTALVLFGLISMTFSNNAFAGNGNPSSINFTSENFEMAKERAEEEGKLFFVDFYANWCAPCKWMETTTFKDPRIVNMLNDNYISIKVDIDEREGFDLKEKYNVRRLPTILIFNTNGNLVERVEETPTNERLINILSFHYNSNNRVVKNHYFNQSPDTSEPYTIKDNTQKFEDYLLQNTKKSHYRVEVAYYNEYEKALNKVNDIRTEFLEEIVVLNDYKEGKTMYRVLMGRFSTFYEADSFAEILNDQYKFNSKVY